MHVYMHFMHMCNVELLICVGMNICSNMYICEAVHVHKRFVYAIYV